LLRQPLFFANKLPPIFVLLRFPFPLEVSRLFSLFFPSPFFALLTPHTFPVGWVFHLYFNVILNSILSTYHLLLFSRDVSFRSFCSCGGWFSSQCPQSVSEFFALSLPRRNDISFLCKLELFPPPLQGESWGFHISGLAPPQFKWSVFFSPDRIPFQLIFLSSFLFLMSRLQVFPMDQIIRSALGGPGFFALPFFPYLPSRPPLVPLSLL